MQDHPAQTAEIFETYLSRLRAEQADLRRILAAAEEIPIASLSSMETLLAQMAPATADLPLPAADTHPRFRYLDELEARYTMRKKKKSMTAQEEKQHKLAAESAALYAAFNSSDSPGNQAATYAGSGFDISNSQKIAAYNLLLNSKDQDQ